MGGSLRAAHFFPRVLALDVLEKELSGRRRALKFFGDRLRHGEITVDAGRLEFDLQCFARRIVADGGDVAGINRLAFDFRHDYHSARKSTLAINSGVKKRSGSATRTINRSVPLKCLASGAISPWPYT